MTRDEVVRRYGHIDFTSKHWADQQKWMANLEVPHDWFPKWKVSGTEHTVNVIYCNRDIHKPLLGALTSIHDLGLGSELKTFGGCFNIRMVRGSNSHFSAHSYGLALDINPEENHLGSLLTRFSEK